ncbi:hypothetical protein EST38_g10045 [Candolleomyces aberdarensis]|uniref:intramembrane prenyl-peptidase Rce1 n=1 Tax=Candolleomyces aberdarensis TaxID=2316362 RepID=A0A4Q2D8F0_9AGAR|nr:hypothetical protein EST38_g10045 [Candolleomyces aberdarensis]
MYLGEGLPSQRFWSLEAQYAKFSSLIGLRTFVAGPFTEEIVFRACVLAVYHLSNSKVTRMIFLSPLTFGLAHIHHAWDTYNRYGRTRAALRRALITSLFQLFYTTLFGFHTAYIYLRTGSILPTLTAHVFCNIMGFPDIQWEMERFPHRRRAIIFAYVLGIVGFIYVLPRWTYTPDSLFWTT